MSIIKKKDNGKARKKKPVKSYKPGSMAYIWNYLRGSKSAMFGLIVVVGLLILSFLIPYISPYSYRGMDMRSQYATPSLAHPFGCDEIGRDILTRIIYGARYTISLGFFITAFGATIGIILGALAGYFGGWVDGALMRFLDVWQSVPSILLAIAMAAVLGRGYWQLIVACGVTSIPHFARLMRANILSIRGTEYIEAATSINCSTSRIIWRHVLPNAFSPIIVQIAMDMASAGLTAAGLSFLGFGVQPPTPEWGSMLSSAREFIRAYPHMVTFPGLAIMLVVLCLNLIGDALRDALDPRLRQ